MAASGFFKFVEERESLRRDKIDLGILSPRFADLRASSWYTATITVFARIL
jgi:hypothetical protein